MIRMFRPRVGLRHNQLRPGTFVWWKSYHGFSETSCLAVITKVYRNQVSVKSLVTSMTVIGDYFVPEGEDSIFTDMEIASREDAFDYLTNRLINSKKQLDIQAAAHYRLEHETVDILQQYLPVNSDDHQSDS